MSTAEIKQKLIEKINSIENDDLLLEATRLLEIEMNESEKPYQLSVEMESAVNESKEQFKNGKYLEHKNANSEIDEWLGE